MTDQSPGDLLCHRARVELVFLLAHQRKPKGHTRRDWTLLRSLIREALASGAHAEHLQEGPWRVAQRPLRKPGRNGLRYVPLVKRGKTEIMMPTAQESEELVAFLNWCGMPEFGEG
ncbi:MAG TPA: hypothetical protein VH763_04780 [Gemmatimonadales bacterium]